MSGQPLELTPGALGTIVTVNEAREQRGLKPIPGGDISVEEYRLNLVGELAPPGGQPPTVPKD